MFLDIWIHQAVEHASKDCELTLVAFAIYARSVRSRPSLHFSPCFLDGVQYIGDQIKSFLI